MPMDDVAGRTSEAGEQDADLFGPDDEGSGMGREGGPAIDICAPLLPRPWFERVLLMKLPNILRIEPRPFDAASFDGGYEESIDERGVKRLRPRDINVIRWRFRQGEGGVMRRESNARFVQWSDGSESIMLGDEVLNCDRKDAAKAHTYLYAVRYDVIEGQAHLSKRVTVAPATLDSKLHKRLKMTVQQAAIRQDKVQLHLAAKNPEQEKADVEKRAEEAAKLKTQQDRAMARTSTRAVPRHTFMSAAYLEEEEQEEHAAGEPGTWGAAGQWAQQDDALLPGEHRRRRMAEQEETVAAQRLHSAKRSQEQASGRQRTLGQERNDAAAAAADLGRTAAGIKVRRGAILDDDDD